MYNSSHFHDHPPPDHPISHPVGGVFLPTPFSHQFLSIRKALAFLESELKNNSGSSNSATSTVGSPTSPPAVPAYNLHSPTSFQKDVCHPPSLSWKEEFTVDDSKITNRLLQHGQRSESPSGHDNCGSDGVKKVGFYSAEERRERIKRYRSKRNQRNFNKKIKYACRKTLADSRPRVRGRFARNEEMEEFGSSQRWRQTSEGEDDDAWINFLNALSMNVIP